jgi:hypothetical protein
MSDEEFVSVAEAARVLGVSERTARRHLGRLPDSDRHLPETGPATVRLSALSDRLGKPAVPDSVTGNPAADAGHMPDSAGHGDGALTEQLHQLKARLADKDTEIAFLREALTREQETARAALSELADERRRSSVLIAAAATGKLLPDQASAGAAHSTSNEGGAAGQAPDNDRPQGRETVDGAADASGASPGNLSVPDGHSAGRRPWWQFWRGD